MRFYCCFFIKCSAYLIAIRKKIPGSVTIHTFLFHFALSIFFFFFFLSSNKLRHVNNTLNENQRYNNISNVSYSFLDFSHTISQLSPLRNCIAELATIIREDILAPVEFRSTQNTNCNIKTSETSLRLNYQLLLITLIIIFPHEIFVKATSQIDK